MECHWHPGMPGVGYCADCHVFVCRVCAGLAGSPVRCTDCQLVYVRRQHEKLRRRMWRALGGGLLALVVGLWGFTRIAPGGGAVIAAVVFGWVVGGFLLGGLGGPFTLPWLIVKDLRRLRYLRNREALILSVQQQARPAGGSTADESYPEASLQ
jgi:hypothetical protein